MSLCAFYQEVADARRIRNQLLSNFELAIQPTISDEEAKRLLHIVIVGGGPTGVEFGAELYDFVKQVCEWMDPNLTWISAFTVFTLIAGTPATQEVVPVSSECSYLCPRLNLGATSRSITYVRAIPFEKVHEGGRENF